MLLHDVRCTTVFTARLGLLRINKIRRSATAVGYGIQPYGGSQQNICLSGDRDMQRTENEIFLYIQYATEDGEHEKFKIFNPIYNTTQPTARIVFL